jgi:UPF0176 protein
VFEIAAFYKFTPLPTFRQVQSALREKLQALGAKGSVLLAEEGLNGTISTPHGQMTAVLEAIATVSRSGALEAKFSTSEFPPFKRMKVRLKKEIVTMGAAKSAPHEVVGEYVDPADWNALISDPDVVLVDARNAYEHRIGTFRNAIDPGTESFSQFPGWVTSSLGNMKGKKIATFCTGGIRCEKATSFMKLEGFDKVYHLKGGILKYLETIPPDQSLWQGACYVFDERVAVEHGLAQSDFTTCRGCLMPVSAEERTSPLYEEGVCCPACAEKLSDEQRSSNRERQRQFVLAEKRGTKHLGPREG